MSVVLCACAHASAYVRRKDAPTLWPGRGHKVTVCWLMVRLCLVCSEAAVITGEQPSLTTHRQDCNQAGEREV